MSDVYRHIPLHNPYMWFCRSFSDEKNVRHVLLIKTDLRKQIEYQKEIINQLI